MMEERSSWLPNGWAWVRLNDISDILLGQSPPSITYNDTGNGLPFFQGKLEFGAKYPNANKWCSNPIKVAEKNDLLVSVRAPVGATNICPEKSCIGRGLSAIRGREGIEQRFLFYFFRTNMIISELNNKSTGTTFKSISGNVLKNLEIPLPPLPEQHRIVNKIEELFTRLDAGIEALNKVKAQLKLYRQAVLKSAFEGKLTEEWREANKDNLEPASELLQRIKEEKKKSAKGKYKELPTLDTTGLPELPEGWSWTRVGDVYNIVSGGTPSTHVNEYWNGNIPWITSADIHDLKDIRPRRFINIEAVKNSATNLVPEESLIVVTRVGLGKIAVADEPMCFSQDSQALVKNSFIYAHYALYCLYQAIQVFKYINRGTTIAGVTKKQLSDMLFPLPPFREQQKIVGEIERHFSIAYQAEIIIDQNLEKAETLKQSIFKRAFEGKLVPQDPNDEPAEKLLERIKAEKQKEEKTKTKRSKK